MLLLLYCLPLLFKVLQLNGLYCSDVYIVYHYSLRCDRGDVHVVVILYIITIKDFTVEWFVL